MSTDIYDVIVIGAGPAGLAIAAETAGAGLRTLVLDKLGPGGALINLGALANVAGPLGGPISGPSLVGMMTDDVTAAGGELGFGEVTKIIPGDSWTVETAEGEQHRARAVAVATGLTKGHLGIDGEADWEGRGLSHCASCDGPLFTGQPVAVAGSEGWAAHEVSELATLAARVIVVGDAAGIEPAPNVEIMPGKVVSLQGADGLDAITVENGGARTSVPANAIFVYVGQAPAAEFVADSLARDATGHIVVDENGAASTPSGYAAGDVVAGLAPSVENARASGERAARAIIARLKS